MLKNILIFLILQTSTLFANKTIILSTGEWEPFTSASYKSQGVVNVIVKEAFKLQNINVEYKFYPWKRAMLYVKTGKHEGSTIWTKTDEREKSFLYSDKTILITTNSFFYLADLKFDWDGDIKKLKNFRLGVSRGYSYSNELAKAFNDGTLKPDIGIDDIKNLRKLMLKRTDIFLCDKDVCATLIKKYFSKEEQEKFIYKTTTYKRTNLFLLLNKNQKELKKEFDIGFEKLVQSGRYKEIITQFEKGESYVD